MDKILIIQTAFLGDLLLSIPMLLRLRMFHPKAEITLLCRKGLGEIFRELKLANHVIEINKKDKKEFAKDFSILKKNTYDLLISPHQSLRTAYMAVQIKAKQKIGFKEKWNFFVFNQPIVRNMKLPDALRQMSLLTMDLELQESIKNYNGKIPALSRMGLKTRIMSHPKYNEITNKFGLKENSIFIAPGSVWNTKRWTSDGFKKLAKKLSAQPIVFIGSADERDLCEEVKSEVSNAINLAGKTSLFELLVLMTKGKVLISNDSGSMHLGSVAELPTVAVFGPTVLELGYQPWQEKSIVVENKELKCRPCGKHGHQKCPIGTHECMKSISSDMVLENIKKLIP